MADHAHVQDAALDLDRAARSLARADDPRARKLLGHVRLVADVARGLAEAMGTTAAKVCGTCRYRENGRCHADPAPSCMEDWPPVEPGKAACRFWEAGHA